MLKSGEIDIAVCNLPVRDSALEIQKCIDVHDIFVCGEKYKHLSEKPRAIEEIMKEPVILLERKSNSRQYIDRFFQTKGIRLQPEIELGSHELLLEFAKFNFGVSCVIEEFSQEHLTTKTLYKIKLTDEIPKRSIGFCFLKSVSLSAAARNFVSITLEE
jgi:DNA-binding transcriptional LysR family regulator